MRLLHVIESLSLGGAEAALVTLVRAQVAAGLQVGVCALESSDTLAPEVSDAGAHVEILGFQRSANPLPKLKRFNALIDRMQPQILHSHLLHADVLVAMAGSACGKVSTLHNLIHDAHPPRSLSDHIKRTIYGGLMRNRFDRHIAVSTAVADHYRQHLRIPPPCVVHNAVAVDAGLPWSRLAAAETWGLDPTARWVVNPARLVPEKGQATLLDAFAQVAERNPRLQLVIAGGGPLAVELHQQAGRIGDRARLLGPLPPAELRTLLSHGAIGVLPSLSEGLGVALVEMMLAGLPIVASRVGGIPELAEHGVCAELVEPGDAGQLANALMRLADEPERGAAFGREARLVAAARCGPGEVAGRLSRIYDDVLSRKGAASMSLRQHSL